MALVSYSSSRTAYPQRAKGPQMENRIGLSALFAAAVVNREFRNLLLRDPKTALKNGYLGEQFHLSSEEQTRLTSIQAESLADLAQQLMITHTIGD